MTKIPENSQLQSEIVNEFRPYDSDTEIAMKKFYDSLSEKDKRRYAGIEALKLGHGGQKYIAKILGCSRNTVKKGACEVSDLPPKEVDKRIRQAGGGRKKYTEKWSQIDEQFLAILKEHTAGDPMDEQVVWTDLTHEEIQQLLGETYAVWVSKPIIKKLLKKHGYRRRQAQKNAP
jgi:transposase